MGTKIKLSLESLDTTVNQQTAEQVQIVKEAASKVGEAEMKPIVERPEEANPDASVSGEVGINGDSSVNGEKPTAGIDSGSAEFTSALEELENEIEGSIIDVGTMFSEYDNTERLSTVVNGVESPTENELALINLAADIANVSDTDEQIAVESIDEVRTLIHKRLNLSSEGISDSVKNVLHGIMAWFKGKYIMWRTTAGRLDKLARLLKDNKGKKFTIEAKAKDCNYLVMPNGECKLLFKSSDWAAEVKKTWDTMLTYMNLLGQGIVFMARDFNQALTKLAKSDDEKNEIARTEYNNYIDKMIVSIRSGMQMSKDGETSKGNYSEYATTPGVAGFTVTVKHTEISASEVTSGNVLTSALKNTYSEVSFMDIDGISKDKVSFEIDTSVLLDMVQYIEKKNDEACRIFDKMFMYPLQTLTSYLESGEYRIPSKNNHGVTNAIIMGQNAMAAIQNHSMIGKLMTALAENAYNATHELTDAIDTFEADISKFVTSVVVSKEIKD